MFCAKNKADGICCDHHEDVEDCSGCTDVSIPGSAAVLLGRSVSLAASRAQKAGGRLTFFSGRTRAAIISGSTKSVITHPHVKRRKDRSCQSATKVNETSVATIVLELFASGT